MLHYDPEHDDELEYLRLEAMAERQYRNRLARHPDPRDPDYPGPDHDEGEDE